MATQSFNPKDLKDSILRRLGAPIINIEVTTEQIYDCIQRSLELYGEYHYDGFNKGYQAFYIGHDEVSQEKFRNGVFDLSGRNIFAVTQIIRTNVGSLTSMDGQATYPWFTDFVLGMAGINGGMGSSCNTFGPNAFGADLSYFTQLMQYRSMMQDLMVPLPDYWYNDDTEQLKIMGNFRLGDVIVIEVYTASYIGVDGMAGGTAGYGYAGIQNNDQWSLGERWDNPDRNMATIRAGEFTQPKQGAYNNRWVKDYATALTKEVWGNILAKNQGLMLPGGVTVDGVRLIEESRLEKERLREELDLLDPPFGILVG
ncbi:head-tail adaptor Ad2 [Pectobacterium bacteriophage PM2]|uniref:Head completion, neck hetero-dimeric protein n=1 Tax=Pectobacterium bacteriophage PM2 TaxID=1429794 RepID=A0A0A0Q2G3_9CAUD|nr:head-tail adaptor Ad2 [Pectobacterium bacteriophage PM2]AHY25145.1 head completion, neck hetero-dimeric protein [Pectobacterium bacteriophage PM2]